MEYKHKKTGLLVKLEMDGTTAVYKGDNGNLKIHPAIVEYSYEWELFDTGKKHSIEDIRKAFANMKDYNLNEQFISSFINQLKEIKNG